MSELKIKKYSPQNHMIKALIYGASGTRKTSFGGTAKDVIFASAENGLLSVADKEVAYVEIKGLHDLWQLLNYLKTEKHNYKTLVIDSITEIADLTKIEIEQENGKKMQIQDWGDLASRLELLLKEIKDFKNMHIITLAQEMLDKDEDKVVKIMPSLSGKTATKISYYMDIVAYVSIDNQGQPRIMTGPHEKYVTKDRTGKLGATPPFDFEEWVKAVKDMSIKEEEVIDVIMTPEKKHQYELFNSIYEELKSAKDLKQLGEIYKKVGQNIKILGKEKCQELVQLKDDMKASLSKKESKNEIEEKKEENKNEETETKEDSKNGEKKVEEKEKVDSKTELETKEPVTSEEKEDK